MANGMSFCILDYLLSSVSDINTEDKSFIMLIPIVLSCLLSLIMQDFPF